jgi:predicted O-methyltransferase YrrM
VLDKLMSVFSRADPTPPAATPPSFRHEESFLTLEETATDRRFDMPYRKTYDFDGDYIDAAHRALTECPTQHGMIDLGIEGWLLPADALKLYELAYFGGGDVLELGSYRGLSTSLLASASVNTGRRDAIYSVDLSPEAIVGSQATMKGRPGAERVSFLQMDGDSALAKFIKARKRFRFAFVDHSHRYEHVKSACALLPQVLVPGAFVLFHDYNDYRNPMPNVDEYGVYQGVRDGLDMTRFEFWGVYGCTGLFRFGG